MAIVRTAVFHGGMESIRCACTGTGTSAAAMTSSAIDVRRGLRSTVVVTPEICRTERSRGGGRAFRQRLVA
jgi:L-amino acid N-acyltransferase YncA